MERFIVTINTPDPEEMDEALFSSGWRAIPCPADRDYPDNAGRIYQHPDVDNLLHVAEAPQ